MRIAVCSIGEGKLPIIAESISTTRLFIVFDLLENKILEKIANNYSTSPSSEIFSAQLLISKGVNAVVCKKIEENAKKLFDAADVKVIENFDHELDGILNEIFMVYHNL
ncbi:MAG: NifB/NifX family molybdenum-iron cluster-binding protein [Melioribacteraceae bacterium]|nr:MAG: NifB/NifX family molybdenum-iron cluster-binding protein [Melioribacteraceae bacterium]